MFWRNPFAFRQSQQQPPMQQANKNYYPAGYPAGYPQGFQSGALPGFPPGARANGAYPMHAGQPMHPHQPMAYPAPGDPAGNPLGNPLGNPMGVSAGNQQGFPAGQQMNPPQPQGRSPYLPMGTNRMHGGAAAYPPVHPQAYPQAYPQVYPQVHPQANPSAASPMPACGVEPRTGGMMPPQMPHNQMGGMPQQMLPAPGTVPSGVQQMPMNPHQRPSGFGGAAMGAYPPASMALPQNTAQAPLARPSQNAAMGGARPPHSGQSPLDKLKQVGTFMGYPEYTLPESDAPEVLEHVPEPPLPAQPLAKPPSQATSAAVPTMPPPLPAPNQPIVNPLFEHIGEFCQNEKNASEFYRHLSEQSTAESGREALKHIAVRASARSEALKALYDKTTKAVFHPQDRNIKKDIGYFEGLRMAIREENKLIKDCMAVLEKAGATLRDKLSPILMEKFHQITELQLLLNGYI